MFCKKIKFEKIKIDDDLFVYKAISDEKVQKIVLNYCINNNIKLKYMDIRFCNCCVKLKCTSNEANKFILYMLENYYMYFKNFKLC